MDKQIVDHITAVIQRSRYVPLNTLFGRLNGINKKQRAHLNKVGIEKFVTSHPNDLAIIDGIVVTVAPPVLSSVQQHSNKNTSVTNRTRNISASSSESSTVTPPTEGAVESIKKDIAKNNSCVVCSEEMEVYAFGICFHPICYKCSTKLRVLCSDKHCPYCRSELKEVIFSTELTPEHRLNTKGYIKEQKYGITFQTQRIRTMHRSLLEHNCDKSNCGQKFDDFDDLKRHMQKKHGEYFCEICVQQCKIFTHDRRTYSTMELEQHEQFGDSGQGSAHEGHPLCKFCDHRYLDKDELIRHLLQHHCSCHICTNDDYIFYSDPTELWEHFIEAHHACLDPECYLQDRFSVFDIDEELQAHKTKKHLSKKGKSSKRLEQPIALDVQFSSRGGLQFNGSSNAPSASRSFQLPPTQAPTVAADGTMRCHGIVVNLTSWYGFIRPDDGRGWKDNVFFNKQACGLNDDEDLDKHIHIYDRVYVQAKPSPNSGGSNWRAVDVTAVSDNNPNTAPKLIFNPFRTGEDNTGYTSDLSLSDSFASSGPAESELNNNKDSFPALNSANSPPPESPLASSNWSKVVGTKKPQKRIVHPTASSSSTSQLKSSETNGASHVYGYVHYGLFPTYGFLVRPDTAFEDNIYFNLQAYQEGMDDYSIKDLTKVLNINQKLCYILDEPGKIQRQAKSKYRAQKVWRFGHKGETDNGIQPGKSPTTSKPNKPLNKPITKQPIKNEPNRKNPPVELPLKSRNSETVKPANGWITKGGEKATKLDQSGAAGDQHMLVEGRMGLDTIDIRFLSNGVQMNGHHSRNECDIFRNVLGEIFGGDSEDSLFAFDTELEIHGLPIQQIAYVHFSINKPPRVVSVLLNSSTYRVIDLKLSGFQQNAMDILAKKGLAIKSSNNMYYINESSIYVLLVRDETGSVQELYIHTSFGKA